MSAKLARHQTLSDEAGATLIDDIFEDVDFARSHEGRLGDRGLIRKLESDADLWRARVLPYNLIERDIVPFRDIGPPPVRLTKPGRLNALGQPAFYAAFSTATAILEVRARENDSIGVIKVRPARELRVLDLQRADDLYMPWGCSFFADSFERFYAKVCFFNNLNKELMAPIEENHPEKYHATQFFAKHISSCFSPRIDGVIYPSPQRQGGVNVAIFSDAELGEESSFPLDYVDNSFEIYDINNQVLGNLASGRRLTSRSSGTPAGKPAAAP